MNKRIFFLLLLYLITTIACSPIIKTLAGIKDIKLESRESLIDFCDNMDMDLMKSYVKIDKYDIADSSQINFQFADQVIVFNNKGNRIIYNGSGTNNHCSLPGTNFFTGIDSPFLPIDTVNTLTSQIKNYRNMVTDNCVVIEKADYYVVYYWANWYKGLTKYNIKSLNEILSLKEDSIKIQCFYLNNDFFDENYPSDMKFKKLKINASF